LLRKSDNGFQPVIFQDPTTDFALSTAGIAGEERRAVHDDRNAAAVSLGRDHPAQHVL